MDYESIKIKNSIDIVPTNIGTIWTFGFISISELILQFVTCLPRFFLLNSSFEQNNKYLKEHNQFDQTVLFEFTCRRMILFYVC